MAIELATMLCETQTNNVEWATT